MSPQKRLCETVRLTMVCRVDGDAQDDPSELDAYHQSKRSKVLQPLRWRDSIADDIVLAHRRFQETLNQPHVAFSIRAAPPRDSCPPPHEPAGNPGSRSRTDRHADARLHAQLGVAMPSCKRTCRRISRAQMCVNGRPLKSLVLIWQSLTTDEGMKNGEGGYRVFQPS
jgi:hypothetical protein